jgi:diguanylate cyclase
VADLAGAWLLMGPVITDSALRDALREQHLTVHYQPIVRLETQGIVGVEALARWQHPDRGPIHPSEFIPVAEESGLISQLGAWVLQQACEQLAAWHERWPCLSVSVNVSPKQLPDADFPLLVAACIDDAGLRPGDLILEITEGALMGDIESCALALTALKSAGASLAVDDFGTGYSSLAYVKAFPIDALKIDKSFVDGLGHEERDAAIVAGVVAMARALAIDVVAEGVERSRQALALRALGCPMAQGFHFAEPLPAPALTRLLEEGIVDAER